MIIGYVCYVLIMLIVISLKLIQAIYRMQTMAAPMHTDQTIRRSEAAKGITGREVFVWYPLLPVR